MQFQIQSPLMPAATMDKLRTVTCQTDGGGQALLHARGMAFTGLARGETFQIHRTPERQRQPFAVAIGQVAATDDGSRIAIRIRMSDYAVFLVGLLVACVIIGCWLGLSGGVSIAKSPLPYVGLIAVFGIPALAILLMSKSESEQIKMMLTSLWQTSPSSVRRPGTA